MTRPSVTGTGLIALDVVVGLEQTAPRFFAGGTCGNVLTILAYMGWESLPVARLGDEPSSRVLEDLRRFGVNLRYATLSPAAATPIIVERIRRNSSGELYHSFAWSCPQCRSRLPGYAPVPGAAIEAIVPTLPDSSVFFFDRVSRGALTLASAAAKRGAIVVFEPSGVGDPKLFREAVSVAHVIKYSQERMKTLGEWFEGDDQPSSTLLEIETLGRGGLRYRTRLAHDKSREWRHIDAFPVSIFRDSAGCGDWTTAGILDTIGRKGLAGLRSVRPSALATAVQFGQALAAWNCAYEGARGGMYHVAASEVRGLAERIISERGYEPPAHHTERADPALDKICVSCPVEKVKRRARRTAP